MKISARRIDLPVIAQVNVALSSPQQEIPKGNIRGLLSLRRTHETDLWLVSV